MAGEVDQLTIGAVVAGSPSAEADQLVVAAVVAGSPSAEADQLVVFAVVPNVAPVTPRPFSQVVMIG